MKQKEKTDQQICCEIRNAALEGKISWTDANLLIEAVYRWQLVFR